MIYPLLYHYGHSMSHKEFVIVLAVSLVIGLIASIFTRKAIVRRNLKKAALHRLADFKHGEIAKVVGTVEFIDEALEAPLSGRKCSWYYIHVGVSRSNGVAKLIEEEQKCRFVIRDGDKVAHIDDSNIKSYIMIDKEYGSGYLKDVTPRLEAYLKKHGHKSEGFLGLRRLFVIRKVYWKMASWLPYLAKGSGAMPNHLGCPKCMAWCWL